jgi:hypothetical protein
VRVNAGTGAVTGLPREKFQRGDEKMNDAAKDCSARLTAQRPVSLENAREHPAFKWAHVKADKMREIQKIGHCLSAKPHIFLRTTAEIT